MIGASAATKGDSDRMRHRAILGKPAKCSGILKYMFPTFLSRREEAVRLGEGRECVGAGSRKPLTNDRSWLHIGSFTWN